MAKLSAKPGGEKQHVEEALAFSQRVCASAMVMQILLEDYGDEIDDFESLENFVEILCDEDEDSSTRTQFRKMLEVEEAMIRAQVKEPAKEGGGEVEEKKSLRKDQK